MQTPLREYWVKKDGLLPTETRAFEAGYKAGIEYQKLETAAQIAALTAELDTLKLQIKARDILLMKIGIDPAKIKVDDNG